MTFTVTKTIIARANSKGRFVGILIILLVLPLLLLLMLFGVLVVLFFTIISPFYKKRTQVTIHTENNEQLLISSGNIAVFIKEDDNDDEFIRASYQWQAALSNRVAMLYRARTEPHIPELHNKFVTAFSKETPKGAFLQVVEGAGSKLVFLDYSTLQVSFVSNIGPYELHDDPQSAWHVKGFNLDDEITLSITQPGH